MAHILASLAHTITSHTSDVNGVAFNNNTLVTCSSDKTVRIWNTDDFTEVSFSPLCGHTYQVYCCALSCFGNYMVTGSMDGKLILWDCKSGSKLAVFEHKSKNCIRTCRFSPDCSTIISGGDDDTLCLWDVSMRKLIRSLEGHEGSVVACAYSPDSSYIASGSTEGDLIIWDGKYGHGKPLAYTTDGHDLGVTSCDFSPSYGSAINTPLSIHFLLASCGNDDLVKLWDVVSNHGSSTVRLQLRDTLAGHGCQVMACCFSADGKLLASGSGDKCVRLWDPLKGEPVHTIVDHTRFVTCVAFSLDGRYLASGSNDKTVKVWKLTSAELLIDDRATYQDVINSLPDTPNLAITTDTPQHWTVEDVGAWLVKQELPQYVDTFTKNQIDGTELMVLDQTTLQSDLGVDALGHRNRILRGIELLKATGCALKSQVSPEVLSGACRIPDEYLCPISREIMTDPVIAADGYTYERAEIAAWLKNGKTRSPMTNANLTDTNLVPNRNLKMLIQRYLQK